MKDAEHDRRLVDEHLAALRAERSAPCEDLVERSVRGAIRAREAYEARPWRALDWLWEPQTVRVRVVSLAAATAAMALAAAIVLRDSPPRTPTSGGRSEQAVRVEEPPAAAVAALAAAVPVRFVLPAAGAKTVSVAGDFNGWRADADLLRDHDGDGSFVATLRLPPGTYTYMFVVDGERWVADPYAEHFRDDGFGNRNAVLRIR